MKAPCVSKNNAGRPLRTSVSILFIAVFLTGCSTLRVDSARHLGSAGQQAADAIAENVFISDTTCQQAIDVQTLIFYHDVGEAPPQDLEKKFEELTSRYKAIHEELKARRLVFTQLGVTYSAFAELTDNESAAETEAAIRKLGEAVNKYAEAAGKEAVLSGSAQRSLGTLGKLAVVELKKKKIKQASALIRERLTSFTKLLKEPLVKEQLLGFQANLETIKKDGVLTLWETGILDPSPMLDQIGADIGLRAAPDAAAVARQSKNLSYGLTKIIASRFETKMELIEESYAASISAMEELIHEHEALEKDGPLNLTRLISIAAKQQHVTKSLAPDTNREATK
jgi:5'-deoxynucleotidase YfbR-like HD superfamily hydrolase